MPRQFLFAVSALLCAAALAQAQWVTIKLPNTPRTKDGTPNLTAPPPRLRDGKTDFSGIWYEDPARTDPEKSAEGQTVGEDRPLVLMPADGSPLPLLPAAAAAVNERIRRGDLTPSLFACRHGWVTGCWCRRRSRSRTRPVSRWSCSRSSSASSRCSRTGDHSPRKCNPRGWAIPSAGGSATSL